MTGRRVPQDLRTVVLPAVLLLTLFFAAAPISAAESVRVRGGVHAEFGRLVFDWRSPVGYAAEVADGRLTVRFERPAAFDTSSAERHLFRYLEGVRVGEDGRSLTFALEGDYGLTGFTLGPKVVLDLRNDGSGGKAAAGDARPAATPAEPLAEPETAPAAAPQQAAGAPTEAPAGPRSAESAPPAESAAPDPAGLPEVRVRVGTHPGFERLVFDWPASVAYEVSQEGEAAEVVFARPARLDVSRLRADPPELLRRFEDRRVAGRTRVALRVASGARVRAFADGPRVVVDLMRPGEAAVAAAPAADPSEAAAPTSLLPPEPAAETAQAAAPQAATLEETTAEARRDAASSTAATGSTTDGANDGTAPEASGRRAAQGTRSAAESAAFVTREELAEPENRPQPGSRAPQTPPVLLRFAWPPDTGAVAARRGPSLLLGFDGAAPVDLAARVAELAPELGPVAAVAVAEGSLLRFDAAPFYAPRLVSDGAGWLVEFRRAGAETPSGAPLEVRRSGDRASLYVAVDRPRARLEVTDPESGDRLVLVPLAGEGQATPAGRDFPAFELLPTVQGLAIRPRLEPLEIALAEDGVRIDAPAQTVSPSAQVSAAERAAETDAEPPRLFDLPAWRQGGPEAFNDIRQELQRAAISEQGAGLGLARLELARFYFAHGLGSEALGVLALLRRENRELRADPELLLLEAASRLLVGDHARAQELLGEPALLEEPEADLWRAALAAEAQDWAAAATLFAATTPLVEEYARPVRVRLGLAAVEATLEAGDIGAAALRLELVEPDLTTDLEEARYDFLNALLLAAEGAREESRETLERLAASGLGAPSVQARLALIDRALAVGEMPPAEAIEQLEQLRFAWRGDAFEFALLQRLAELYEQEGRWREALRALRQAATYFPGTPRAEAAAQRLSALFARLFLGPDKPEVPPLTALSLYEEFRELTPVGARGNRLIEQLADRLVAVDLLDRAASLLEGQVQFRLSGEEKARVGARLALIRLLDRKPREALKALEISAGAALAPALARQRGQLQARALSDIGRSRQALALLDGDDSLDATRLRAEILWGERDWAAAAVALAATLPAPAEADVPLSSETSGQVLNLAVAHTLAGDRQALQALRAAWAGAMAEGPHAEAFALLAEDLDPASVATIAQQLAQVDRVQAFIATYRARLRETQLSDLN